MNVFDFAIKMELDGRRFYEKLALGTELAGLRNIFLQLAADEQKHHELLLALKGQTGATAMENSTALEQARNVFEDLLARKETLGPVKGDLEAYHHAMGLEADSFRLYEEAAEKEKDRSVRELLLRIAGEEHKHFNILRNIHDFISAPSQFLAWGEFSNLAEFHQFGRDVD